jgi:perosamine synthetase
MQRVLDMAEFTISPLQKHLVNKCLNNNRLSYGEMTEEFEKQWAELHGVKYALFCNSGTSALQVSLHALKDKYQWNDWDEVIIPATTFVATMNVVFHNNLMVRFVDVEPKYFNLDPDKIEAEITDKTRCIIVVHLLGQPAQMDKIMKIARKHNLTVIEDSCETVGATFDGKPVGSFGNLSCFSTYASHLVVTGVGGFVCTNDPDLALMVKGLYNHGRDGLYHSIEDDDANSILMIEKRFNFVHSGYSYRATELESALGLGHLRRFPKELEQRQQKAVYMIESLSDLEKAGLIQLPHIHPKATHSYMLFGIVCLQVGVRDKLIQFLEENGIMTRYAMPLLNQPVTKKLFGNLQADYPVSDWLIKQAFLIGIHPNLTQVDIKYISKKFHEFYAKDIDH